MVLIHQRRTVGLRLYRLAVNDAKGVVASNMTFLALNDVGNREHTCDACQCDEYGVQLHIEAVDEKVLSIALSFLFVPNWTGFVIRV